MNSNDLLDIIGDARDSHVLDAVKARNGAHPEQKQLIIKRVVLIAAVVALALLLCAGCAMESFGTPYFAPAVPAMRHNGDLFWRFPERWQQKRPGMAHPQKPRRTSAPRGWEKGGEKP